MAYTVSLYINNDAGEHTKLVDVARYRTWSGADHHTAEINEAVASAGKLHYDDEHRCTWTVDTGVRYAMFDDLEHCPLCRHCGENRSTCYYCSVCGRTECNCPEVSATGFTNYCAEARKEIG